MDFVILNILTKRGATTPLYFFRKKVPPQFAQSKETQYICRNKVKRDMSRQHHYLKILPEYYRAIENGDKTFEVRYNDRNYQKYDILHLQEWVNGVYTKREIDAEVVYLLDNPDYCKEGFVIMGIKVHNVRN